MRGADDQVVFDALVAAYPEARDDGNLFSRVAADDESTVWGKLRMSLQAHKVFGKGRHVFAGAHQLQLHPVLVSEHLGRPLKRRGPEDTLRWLHEIYSVEEIVSRRCAELLGVKLDHEMKFSNGVRIVPFEDMRASYHADQLKYLYAAPQPLIRYEPQDIVGMFETVPLRFSTDHKAHKIDYSAFAEVALGITVAADAAPVVGVGVERVREHRLCGCRVRMVADAATLRRSTSTIPNRNIT
ncbi:hypothetical protein OLZ32_31160 [Rhizobium sp. 1AS11]|uniref:hypothetical protein n=1 Tax=Rhizobium acaciae TaxID=2989736 RepID=UPI0022221C9D|nr:hypothetical protein [Rhizobium acaciae]MCW1412557.1 hypothetical protein [Rhizobium acaciae]MCW1744836.1 hypothetical protein [Rhizobium acaciae]